MATLYVISDATGGTAERVVRAALVQFSGADVRIERRQEVRTAEQVRKVVEEAAGGPSLILHTLVSDELRKTMLAEARRCGVEALDMLGPLLDRLAALLRLTPQEMPGLFEERLEARSREIEAVDFAFRHDDGAHLEDLDRAEVVLVGVSRSMKTPTMLHLASHGWFAANVPLIPELDLPGALLRVPSEKVFCLVMQAERLAQLRRIRAEREGIPVESYASLAQAEKEVRLAQRACTANGWRRIDVTNKSVEEAAREIIGLLPGRGTR
ncbi:MAG: pyruvate, water dikinase regulatory protein [Thermoguttaceae bacterium]